MKPVLRVVLLLLMACICTDATAVDSPIVRELPPGLSVPAAARPGLAFDVDRATEAWLGLLSPEQRKLSDDYFEGGYWLQLWNVLYGVGVMLLLLVTGLSRRMRDLAERISKRPLINVAIYAALFFIAIFVLGLPFGIYSDFVREHQYGLSNLSLVHWFGEALMWLGVTVVLGSVLLTTGYAAVRRAGKLWWLWATGLAFAFVVFLAFIEPLFIAPLFNDYKPLPEGPARDAVLSLARANGVPTNHVEWFDASKQTTRISAKVSGLWGVARINLNDNLLNKTSLPEIKAVLGHEMGHYLLNHAFKFSIYITLVFGIAFFVLHVAFDRALARWGPRWGLRGCTDPAAFPLAYAIFTAIWLLFTPLQNTIVRNIETEADVFGLNAAREPEGFAMAAMRLSTYRKIKPGPLEELLFYDHPSGYNRVRRAMVWRKENLPGASPPSVSVQ